MDKLLEILEDVCPDVDFGSEEHLIDNRVISSFDLLAIIGEISDAFDVTVPAKEIVPANFNSAGAMWALISRLKGEK